MSAGQAMSRTPSSEVEPVVAPPPGNPRFPLVDGLRAIAALSVFVYHAAFIAGLMDGRYGAFLSRLGVGVAIFFVISGFLLYRPFFAASFQGGRGVKVGDYARRRVLRIVPAYWVALTALAIAPGLPGVFSGDWWRFYGFLQLYGSDTMGLGIGQAWSLCVEITFYAALPVYALGMRRLGAGLAPRARVRLELSVLAGLFIAGVAFRSWAVARGSGPLPWTLPSLIHWFVPGMALAVLSVASLDERPLRPVRLLASRPAASWGIAAAVFVAMGLLAEPFPEADADWFVLTLLSPFVGVFLILPAIWQPDGRSVPSRVLGWRPLAGLGVISYGFFLWHKQILESVDRHMPDWVPGGQFVSISAVSMALTIAVAAGSYYVVERPLARLKDRRRSLEGVGSVTRPTAQPAGNP